MGGVDKTEMYLAKFGVALGLVVSSLATALPACSSSDGSSPADSGAPGGMEQPGDKQDEDDTQDQDQDQDNAEKDKDNADKEPDDPQDDPQEDDKDDPGDDEDDVGDPSVKFDLPIPDIDMPNSDEDDCDCKENSDLIFVLGDGGSLWLFNPENNEFKDLGKFDCDTQPGQMTFSMGVDRNSRAWVMVQPSGNIHIVDTLKDNQCEKAGNMPGAKGVTLAGMAFVEHPKDGRCEQLYLHSWNGDSEVFNGPNIGSLATIDPESMKTTKLGSINYNGGELTGTGDGRLYAFSGRPAELVEYDPKSAKVLRRTSLKGLKLTTAFAFAFWGGDFYFFTDGDLPFYSKVTKLDFDGSGELSTVVDKAPVRAVGAGVSVCAPLDPPG